MKEGYIEKSMEATAAEMEAINRYTRRNYRPEEVYTFSLVLCDNDVDRDFECFPKESLEKLSEMFLGKTCILDHERKSSNQTARIYQTRLERAAGQRTQAGEELARLTAKAYLPRTQGNEETIELIDSGILKEVSVSCSVKRRACSICGKEECAHTAGKTYGGKLAYALLLEPADAYECSFVAVPAQRGAGVVKRFLAPGEKVEKLLSSPPDGEVLLTKAQVREIGRRFSQLAEKAQWGQMYRRELEEGVLKYSAIAQPQMPRKVMEAAVKGLGLGELSMMERAYRQMAQSMLPLKPQLAPDGEEERETCNGAFLI